MDVLKWKLGITPKDPPLLENSSDRPEQVEPDLTSIHSPDPNVIQITWIGHSSFLIQTQGSNILIDPVYAKYCSPLPLPSLRRLQNPGIPWEQLPAIDTVLITHNHYDHLDAKVVKKLANSAQFFVPEGLDSWMKWNGVQNVTSLSWWDNAPISDKIQLTACPAQHGSARTPKNRNKTHWCGWMLEIKPTKQKIYHAGDTGYCPHFQEIAKRFSSASPIDIALLPIGAYSPRALMHPVHINPEEAVQIHQELQAIQSIACHWGTFRLTDEPVMEPLELLKSAKKSANIKDDAFIHLPIGGSIKLPANTTRSSSNLEFCKPHRGDTT